MSMCRVLSSVAGRGCLLWWVHSLANTLLDFALLHSPFTPRPNLPVTPGISWLPTFAFQSSIMKRTFFWVLVLEGLVGLHRTVQLQLLQHYWLGHRLGLLWYWMVCLGNEQRSFCRFWDYIQVRNLYAGQEATVRTGWGKTDWFQIGKGVRQGCILSPCLFNLYAEYIMRNTGLEEAQAGTKIAGRNINNLWYADDTTLMVEHEEELKSLLMKVKEESEKVA